MTPIAGGSTCIGPFRVGTTSTCARLLPGLRRRGGVSRAVDDAAVRETHVSTLAATEARKNSRNPAPTSAPRARGQALRVVRDRVRFPAVPGCATTPGETNCAQLDCRYHLAHPDRGARRLSVTRDCALAVANEGPHTLQEVARTLGITRERVRQIEEAAIRKLRSKIELQMLYEEVE
ncbi:MAG: sigma factor-like helix-turn-helix DNA-binding protein [Myxococcota bacterium]